MSKYYFNPNVKIVKSCKEKTSPPSRVEPEPAVCPDIWIPADETFLDNVDQEILYANESIEIKDRATVIEVSEELVKEELPVEESSDESPACLEHSPSPLSEQFSMPIQDSDSLYFYEFFMISEPICNDDRINRLVPKHDEINEIGSACTMAEKIDDGNVMVYIKNQMLNDDENVTLEILSVVNLNLQLVHEKRIERSCVNGRFMVVINENVIVL